MHAPTLYRSRAHSIGFRRNSRDQPFPIINPLVGHDDKPYKVNVAYDGNQTAQSMLDSAPGGMKIRMSPSDSSV